jgi:hypothetical protein
MSDQHILAKLNAKRDQLHERAEKLDAEFRRVSYEVHTFDPEDHWVRSKRRDLEELFAEKAQLDKDIASINAAFEHAYGHKRVWPRSKATA